MKTLNFGGQDTYVITDQNAMKSPVSFTAIKGDSELIKINNEPNFTQILTDTTQGSYFGEEGQPLEITENTTLTYTFATPFQCTKLGRDRIEFFWDQIFSGEGDTQKRFRVIIIVNYTDNTNDIIYGGNPFVPRMQVGIRSNEKAISSIDWNISLIDPETRTEGTCSISKIRMSADVFTGVNSIKIRVGGKYDDLVLCPSNTSTYTISQAISDLNVSQLSAGNYEVMVTEDGQAYFHPSELVYKGDSIPNEIVNLTTNLSSNGTLGGDSLAVFTFENDSDAYKAFDGNAETYWQASAERDQVLGLYIPEKIKITEITIIGSNIVGGVYGINNLDSWTSQNISSSIWNNPLGYFNMLDDSSPTTQTLSLRDMGGMRFISVNYYMDGEHTMSSAQDGKIYEISLKYESDHPANNTIVHYTGEFPCMTRRYSNGQWTLPINDVPIGKVGVHSGVITSLENYPIMNRTIDAVNNVVPGVITEYYLNKWGEGYFIINNTYYIQFGKAYISSVETFINMFKTLESYTFNATLTVMQGDPGQAQNNVTLFAAPGVIGVDVCSNFKVISTQQNISISYQVCGKVA